MYTFLNVSFKALFSLLDGLFTEVKLLKTIYYFITISLIMLKLVTKVLKSKFISGCRLQEILYTVLFFKIKINFC